ncbi:MAG: sugar phosphate isomerase/epimerase [Chloroflexi bacterium]|nr:sugar phosphate isomerase/epimerase [Chloroflexota bacterium]
MMIPTLFTVSYAGFWGQARLSLADSLRKAKELGYSAVEIAGKRPHLSVVDCDIDEVKSYRRLTDELGLKVASLAAYTNFTAGMESREVPLLEIQLGYIDRLAQFANVLGSDLIRIFTGYQVDALSFDQQWNLCVEAVQGACDVAARHGVRIGVQNHHDIGVGVEAYEDFLAQVSRPNCYAMFDAWSIAQHGTDLYSAAKRLAPKMAQTTVADYVRQPRYKYLSGLVGYERLPDVVRAVPLGEGFIDYPAFFGGLRDGGFDGYVSFEMCSPVKGGGSLANLDRTASAALKTLQEWMAG